MTEETKKIFVAPWEATAIKGIEWGVRIKDSGLLLCDFCEEENAKRFARLPELYEALLDEIRAKCNTCIHDNIRLGRVLFINHFNTIQSGCPFKDRQCHTVKHIEIIQKVRGGK